MNPLGIFWLHQPKRLFFTVLGSEYFIYISRYADKKGFDEDGRPKGTKGSVLADWNTKPYKLQIKEDISPKDCD